MASILFIVFSGQASAIFDSFLYSHQERYKELKKSNENPTNHFVIETQWDNGGHTGFMLDFYDWLKDNDKFKNVFPDNFIMPPPMGDLKTQISRWAGYLIKNENGKNISQSMGYRFAAISQALAELTELINTLKEQNLAIFSDEDNMNILNTFSDLYKEFSQDKEMNHSVGNLFLSFLYFYSFKRLKHLDQTLYEHHHQVFFNFLKDLSLVPRGCRFEFLIDGRYKLSADTFDGIHIPSEHHFDDYVGDIPANPETYSITAVDGEDLDHKFREMINVSDIVVIPPGSLSNWMPLINKFKAQLLNKPIIWVVNSFYHVSEVNLRGQIEYMRKLKLDPIVLAPKVDTPFDGLDSETRKMFEESYSNQQKKPVNFNETLANFQDLKVLRCIPLKELEAGEGGIKYKSEFIDILLSQLSLKAEGYENTETIYELSEKIVKSLLSQELKVN